MAAKLLLCGKCFSSHPRKKKWNPLERVFGNELLFNKILKFAVHHNGVEIDMKTAHSCKLVNSSWLEGVNVALKRKDEPLVKLNTCTDPNKIIKYVHAFAGCPPEDILRYNLTISPTYLDSSGCREMVYTTAILQSGIKCLAQCGYGLVELTIYCERAEWDMLADSLLPPSVPLNLPHLQKIKIAVGRGNRTPNRRKRYLIETVSAEDENVNEILMHSDNINTAVTKKKSIRKMDEMSPNKQMTNLVKKIFAASDNVKYLSLIDYSNNIYISDDVWWIDTRDLTLPKSLQEIHIFSGSSEWALRLDHNLFTRSSLSSLTSLTLEMNLSTIDCKLKVIRILNVLNRQLQKLDISNAEGVEFDQIFIRLPVMPNLKELWCGLWICHGEQDICPILQTHFPVLQKFVCFETSTITLLNWIAIGDKASSVVDVHVEFTDPRWLASYSEEEFLVSEKMCRIKSTFSKLSQLSLVFSDFTHQLCGMNYIFKQLTRLHVLQVHQKDRDVTSDEWNAILLGIGVEEARMLQNAMYQGFNNKIKFQMGPSIVNLQDLKRLYLSTSFNGEDQSKCYLGVTVKYGISRMPNLVDFSFSDGFSLEVMTGG